MSKKHLMTAKEMLPILAHWEKTMNSVNGCIDVWIKVGLSIGTPLTDAIHEMQSQYSDVVTDLIGDDWNWLEWYRFDNEMGSKQLEATDGIMKLRKIKDINDLAHLIEFSNKKNE